MCCLNIIITVVLGLVGQNNITTEAAVFFKHTYVKLVYKVIEYFFH